MPAMIHRAAQALGGHQKALSSYAAKSAVPPLTNSELVQLRFRVIALENLVVSLLAVPYNESECRLPVYCVKFAHAKSVQPTCR